MDISVCRQLIDCLAQYDIRTDPSQEADGTALAQLVLAVADPAVVTWEDAAARLRPRMRASTPAFQMLVSRLREHLLHAMLHLQPARLTDSPQVRFDIICYHDLATARVLLAHGMSAAANAVLQRVLKRSIRYELTHHVCSALRTLCLRTAFDANRTAYTTYRRQLTAWEEVQAAEDDAEALLQQAMLDLHVHTGDVKRRRHQRRQAVARLEILQNAHPTYRIRMCSWRVAIWHHQDLGEHNRVVELCDEAIAWVQHHQHFFQRVRIAELETLRLSSCMQIRDFALADTVSERALGHLRPGSMNWLVYLELSWLFAMRCRQYDKAVQIATAVYDKAPKALQPWRRQQWRMFRAYLQLLMRTGRVAIPESHHDVFAAQVYPMRLEATSEDLVRDKRGANIALLILRTYFLLLSKRYSEIIGYQDALRTYATRYTRTAGLQRSARFLRLLARVVTCDFDPVLLQQRAGSTLEELQTTLRDLNDDAEYVPYDDLWAILLDVLAEHKADRRRRR